ncbi:chromosome-partitioning ATPase Soj [Thermus thermamylovorans]|uniref:ParA family protein n=1 Tax=Thermus thermamylovorans TaxID=2509362 RepID=A0A4Q9B8N7_9DEIN|nr:chromosome-partitioning ATPase Soj [Thermus thermamylovorans]TBH21248.1 ParA family protein [Thermus thermamylovorans]
MLETRVRRIALVNQKGGVGKTTTAINLAAYLARLGKRVLLVDLDPQGNATGGLGLRPGRGVYQLLQGEPLEGLVHPVDGFHLLPSTPELVGATVELAETPLALAETLRDEAYDFTLLDPPPSLSPLTLNALAAAQGVVVPVQAEYYALEGVAGLLVTLEEVRGRLNPGLRLLGILVTMYDGRTLLSQQVEAQLRAHFGERVFWTVVPRNVRLAEAPSFGRTIAQHAPTSPGAHAYRRLAEEVIARVQEA